MKILSALFLMLLLAFSLISCAPSDQEIIEIWKSCCSKNFYPGVRINPVLVKKWENAQGQKLYQIKYRRSRMPSGYVSKKESIEDMYLCKIKGTYTLS